MRWRVVWDHQVDFDIFNVLDILDVVGGDIEGAARRVHLRKAHEIVIKSARTLFVCGNHIGEASANSLFAVHIQLTETTVDTFGLPDVIRFVVNGPAGNRHTAGNNHRFAIGSLVTHIMTIFTAIAFVKTDSSGQGVGSLAENHLNIARHGAIYGTHGLLRLRNRLERGILRAIGCIVTARRDIERGLRRRKGGSSHSQT